MTSERYSEHLEDVEYGWTMARVCRTHDFLDFFDAEARKARARAKREAEAARRHP